MNQNFYVSTSLPEDVPKKLYVFDCDGTLYAHTGDCYQRMGDVGAQVIHAYTGIPLNEAFDIGVQSWNDHEDGFLALIDQVGVSNYHAMHRHFDMVANLDRSGVHDPNVPHLLWALAQMQDTCVHSHTSTRALKTMLTRLDYNPHFVDQHAFGIDAFPEIGRARKNDPDSGVYDRLAEVYKIDKSQIVLIEDSKSNLRCAKECGVGRMVLIGQRGENCQDNFANETYPSVAAFLTREIEILSLTRQSYPLMCKISLEFLPK